MESDEPGPSWATLRSTTKATLLRTHLHYTDGAIDESTQPCIHTGVHIVHIHTYVQVHTCTCEPDA